MERMMRKLKMLFWGSFPGPLANALSLSITEKSTCPEIHTFLHQLLHLPSDTKEIHQFDVSGRIARKIQCIGYGKEIHPDTTAAIPI